MIAYKLTNLIEGKSYIGITRHTAEERWKEHTHLARRSKNIALHVAIRRYGHAAFVVETLASSRSWEDLCSVERALIAQHGTFWPLGYNLTLGGDGKPGYALRRPFTDEERRRISEATRLAVSDPIVKAKSAEACKLREAKKTEHGYDRSFLHNAGVAALKSLVRTPEHTERIRLANLGLKRSPEVRAQMSVSRRGRKLTEEHKRKISDALKRALAAGLLACALSARASADVPVIDISNVVAQAKNFGEFIKSNLTQLQQLQTQVQQYQQWLYIGQQLIHDPSLGTFTQLANRLGLDTSIPLNPYAVQGLISGAGGMRGLNGIMSKVPLLSGLVNTSFTNNQLYNCQTGDPGCQLSQVSAASRAASSGLASKMLADISSHMGNLQSLRDRAATATDPKTVQDLTLQAGIEQNWLQGANGQLQAIGIMQVSQEQSFGQAATQKFQLDGAGFVAAAKAIQ